MKAKLVMSLALDPVRHGGSSRFALRFVAYFSSVSKLNENSMGTPALPLAAISVRRLDGEPLPLRR